MTKNWITLMTGVWHVSQGDVPTWRDEGFCFFDPAAVISVKSIMDLPSGCIIYFNSGGWIAVRENLNAIISEIQSAL